MAKTSGNSNLNFTGQFDISSIITNQQKVIKGFADLRKSAEQSVVNGGSSALREQNLASQQATRASRLELERLKQEEQQLINQQAQLGVSTAELTNRFQQNRLAQQELRIATQANRTAQTAANGSYREAQQRLTALGREIRETAGGFNNLGGAQRARIAEYRQLNERLSAFDRTLGNHQRNVGNYSSALGGLRNVAAGYLSAFAAIGAIGSIIRTNAEVSDSIADIQRTAGLTTKEVNELVSSLKEIDTRTSLKGLLDIAIIGGQLGIARDQLGGFTKAVDQLSVSLAGELQGGAEGVAKSLGILNNVFKISNKGGGDVEKAFNRIGSVILGLGQSGLATGDFLTDFGERVGGVAAQANLSLPVLLSYGAVLQENGVSAEVAGTAFKKLIGSIATKREKFLAVAQIADSTLTLQKFTDVINTDTAKALQLFFNGLQKGGSKTTQFLDLLKSVGLDASRAGQSISALALNQESLNKHIQDSTIDFDEATKSSEQFRLKNDTLAASISKLGNTITNLTTDPNSSLAQYFKSFIDSLNGGIKGIGVMISRLRELQYESAIERFDRSGSTGNFFIGENDVKAEKARLRALKIQENTNEAVKIGNQLGRDAVLDVKANADYTERLAKEQAKLAKIRTDISFNENRAGAVNVKRENELNKELIKQRIVVKSLKDEYGKRAQGTGVDLDKTGEKDLKRIESLFKARNTLQSRIDELIKKSTNKQLSSDDQELESVRDKYRLILAEAVKFNNDPKNKAARALVDTGGLAKGQQAELDAILDKRNQETAKKEQEEAKKKYEKLLEDFMDYGQKREKLLSDFNADALILQNDPRQLTERKKKYEEDVKALDEANGKSLESYEKLFTGIDELSKRSALKLIQNARVQLAKDIESGAIKDEKEIARIKARFNELEKEIKNGTGESLRNLGGQLSDIAGLVGGVDSAFGRMIGTLGNVLSQVGSIKDGIAAFNTAKGKDDTLGQLSAGLGIFGAGISIFKSVFALFDRSQQREEQATYSRDLQNKQTEALNKVLERQISLLDDVYGTERITNYGIALKQAQENELKYQDQLKSRFQLTGDKTVDKLIEELNNTGTVNQLQVFGDKALSNFIKTLTVLPKDIESLQQLLDEGKLDQNTATIVQNLIKANETAIELANNLRREVTGTTIDQLADDFLATLTDGTQDFGKTFEETIQKSIINGFKGEIIRKQLQAFYEQFATLSEGGLTKEEIETLRQSYLTAGEQAKKDIEAIQAITGINLTGNESAVDGIKGKLQRELTETTASEFLGVTRNIYEINVKQLSAMSISNTILNSSLTRLNNIELNTANTVIQLQAAVQRLDVIVTNTGSTNSSARDLGL